MEKKIWFGQIIWLWRSTTYICIYMKLSVANRTLLDMNVDVTGAKLPCVVPPGGGVEGDEVELLLSPSIIVSLPKTCFYHF
jgi:hypothetical protein